MKAIGIDIGGTRIKAAVVDLEEGRLVTKRERVDTPRPATPGSILKVCAEVIQPLEKVTAVGVGFPGVIRNGKVLTAHNLHKDCIGFPLEEELSRKIGRPVKILNDADAAGVAEMRHGAGLGVRGTVVLLTVGTGLGSAVFTDGKLVANTELGRLLFGRKREAEEFISETAREKDGLSLEDWAERFEEVLRMIEDLYWPELIIVGGGGAKDFSKVKDKIETRARLCHATNKNKAGIIGAALWASENL